MSTRLLLIDDDWDACQLMERIFRAQGFQVEMAHAGRSVTKPVEGRHLQEAIHRVRPPEPEAPPDR